MAVGWFLGITIAFVCPIRSSTVRTDDGLSVKWEEQTIRHVAIDGSELAGVSARVALVDPRTGGTADPAQFTLDCGLSARNGALWLDGIVTAAGTEDRVADLVLRVDGVTLPTGDGHTDLLLARSLVNKIPICPLRLAADGRDSLALAMPADAPYVFEFRDLSAEKAVQMRLPLGFSNRASDALRMRAPFSIVIFATDPRWHFRSALARYYALFPARFARVEPRDGGWFFANRVPQIPNPQHYAFFEGQGDLDETHERGLGMFPYNETGSQTIQLPGPGLPRNYGEAIREMTELENARSPAAWTLNGGSLDEQTVHAGRFAYRARSEDKTATRCAKQMFLLERPVDEPLVITAWSKAENVTSHSGNPNDYSIYVDCLLADGNYQFGQCAVFAPGTHDWQQSRWVIQPRSALVDLRVYAMFRNHTGVAWFDDIRICRQSDPDTNILENGDFETLGRRDDIQFVRDNALTDADGHFRVIITDNWGSDVRPATPLSLLRFICNVDPDLRAPENRPTPAARALRFFDTLFESNPGIDGCYIDGAGAWTCWYINHRPDHFAFATLPLTYDPKTFAVGQHGRFAMFKWLRCIQDRYHPSGKTIIGNMGPTKEAWTSYTALDIIGIESSHFQDRALMGYHRFGAYHKPVLPMNFVNLHKLDDRDTAEEFVLASAQWGEFPSTGRRVRDGYQSYGDVCHTYYPALIEMSQAGWEPEPLCEGARTERFGTAEPLYFAIRAPEQGRRAVLRILPEALGAIRDPVAMDAVQLTPMAAAATPQGLQLNLDDGAEVLTIVRISSAENARKWLLERAAHHCENAAIVRGRTETTASLKALANDIRGAETTAALAPLIRRIQSEKSRVRQEPDTLERTSILTELRDAERAAAEWLLQTDGASLRLTGDRLVPVSDAARIEPVFKAGSSGATLLGSWSREGRNILRLHDPEVPDDAVAPGEAVVLQRDLPGASHVRCALRVPVPDAAPVTVVRARNVFFTPVVTARVARTADASDRSFLYTVSVERLTAPTPLLVEAFGSARIEPAQVMLSAAQREARFRVRAADGRTDVVQMRFAVSMDGREVAEATSEFRHLPIPPDDDLATLERGAAVRSDSDYSGYSPDVAIDGVWETTGLHWTKRAWASRDSAQEDGHWLEITLPRPQPVSQAWIYWAIDDSRVFSSRNYDIEIWDGKAWQTVAEVRDNPPSTVTVTTWPSRVAERLRIHQLKSGGPASRPEIMWISEVCLYNRGTLN
jgi:hypothetical protein